MAGMPKDLRRLASIYINVAILELFSKNYFSDSEVSEYPSWSYVEEIAFQLFDSSYQSFQTHPPYPLTALHILAETYEAIEVLQGAEIWRAMKSAPSTDNSSTTSHRIRKALWFLEIFCAIFHSDQPVEPRPFGLALGLIQDFKSHDEMQEYVLGELK